MICPGYDDWKTTEDHIEVPAGSSHAAPAGRYQGPDAAGDRPCIDTTGMTESEIARYAAAGADAVAEAEALREDHVDGGEPFDPKAFAAALELELDRNADPNCTLCKGRGVVVQKHDGPGGERLTCDCVLSPERVAVIAAAEAAGHEKIAPRARDATAEQLADWCASRHAAAEVEGQRELGAAIRAYWASEPAILAVRRHPWADIFIANHDGATCGTCLPSGIDLSDPTVEVFQVGSDGWTGPVTCTKCGRPIDVVVDGMKAVADGKDDESVLAELKPVVERLNEKKG